MSGNTVAKVERITMEAMLADLRQRADLQVSTSEEVAEHLVNQVLAARTIGEVFRSGSLTPASSLVDVELIVHSVSWNESDMTDGGLPFYAVIEAEASATGNKFTVSTGARQACAQLYMAEAQGAFPLPLVFRASKPRPGRTPALWLEMWQ